MWPEIMEMEIDFDDERTDDYLVNDLNIDYNLLRRK